MKLTQKQLAFCLAFIECGSAAAAYRRAYDCSGSTQRTIEKRSGELMQNGAVTGRIAALRAEAAAKAVLSETWVLERLMRNAKVSLGEEKISITYRPRAKDGTEAAPVTVEITDRDPTAANRALELLGKNLGMFTEKHEITGRDGAPLPQPIDKVDLCRRIAHLFHEAKAEAAAQRDNPPSDPRTKH